METFINFINHLSELSLFSYLLVDKESEIIYGEKNLTDIELKEEDIIRIKQQKNLIYNYYISEQKLLLLVYNISTLNAFLVLFIDNELANFVSYNDRLFKISETIHLYQTKTKFPKQALQRINQNILYLKETIIEKELSQQIEQQIYHHDFESEEAMFKELEMGNEDGLRKHFYTFQKHTQTGTLSTESELRSRKNILIVTVSISTRYAIKGGVPYERAYTLSDKLIQDIERKIKFSEIEPPELEVMMLFCKEVNKYKYINYSKSIKKTCEFIHQNIYSPLTIPMVASSTNYSKSHLSKLFKQETGMTINGYIMKQKIEESKRLLAFNQYDLTTISSLLHFTDVSYFIKIFKKYEDQTPKEFWLQNN